MITHKQFIKALKKRVEADLIISQYNLQESKKLIEHITEIKTDETFENFIDLFKKLTGK